jgi:Putative Flp pilus-assembly TadE/G-like
LRRNSEQGIVILLVAVVMLFVIGAMAALSIDVVTLYTARSEAQLAADGAALAGARVLANSGMTSASDSTVGIAAVPLATAVAQQVAANNQVGGRKLNPAGACPGGEICVSINELAVNFVANPRVTVQVQRSDLPTFFARIWGRTTITVKASATAEAYNPSNVPGTSLSLKLPVAPMCVKPWLVPNVSPDPAPANPQIFDPSTGAILDTTLLGYRTAGLPNRLQPACDPDCSGVPLPNASSYHYYPGDPANFPPPTQALPSCTPALTSPYQESIAGCIQTPIACNSQASIDTSSNTRNAETGDAVNCLTHAQNNNGDQYDNAGGAGPPFQFIAGSDNPVPGIEGNNVMVSDSLVTVPVFDVADGNAPLNPVTIIGFLQLFLNPAGTASPTNGAVGSMRTKVINVVGCGKNPMGAQPILGNGASPVAVRLISPP